MSYTNYYTCPVCNEERWIDSPHTIKTKGVLFDNAHYTKFSEPHGSFFRLDIRFCHVGMWFVDQYVDLVLDTTKERIINMIKCVSKSQTDIKTFVRKHEFMKNYDDDMTPAEEYTLYFNYCTFSNRGHKNTKCKIGLHNYTKSEQSDILLECECGALKLNKTVLYEMILNDKKY